MGERSPDSSNHGEDEHQGYGVEGTSSSSPREQDRLLPIANVSRIMKRALPANAKISKEAKETVQECVSEFISFITGEASDKCQKEKRKTINGDDLLWAMSTLGFEDYIEPLKLYLQKYRELEGERVSMSKQVDDSSSSAAAVTTAAPAPSPGLNGAGGSMPHQQMLAYGSHQQSGPVVYGQPQMRTGYPSMVQGSSMAGTADSHFRRTQ